MVYGYIHTWVPPYEATSNGGTAWWQDPIFLGVWKREIPVSRDEYKMVMWNKGETVMFHG